MIDNYLSGLWAGERQKCLLVTVGQFNCEITLYIPVHFQLKFYLAAFVFCYLIHNVIRARIQWETHMLFSWALVRR